MRFSSEYFQMLSRNIDLGIYRAFMDSISDGHWALKKREERKIECNDLAHSQQLDQSGQDLSTSIDMSVNTQLQQFVPEEDANEQAARDAYR